MRTDFLQGIHADHVINNMCADIHDHNFMAGWWTDLKFEDKILELKRQGYDEDQIKNICLALKVSPLKANIPEKLCLTHSELSEAMEGFRKNLMDDKLPHRKMFEVELADTVIRIMDIAGFFKMDLGGAIIEKLEYNATRADHKPENRLKDGGKSF
jgi:NTP pyrophosphatase (non-canonical NTP hydrolase)